MFQLFRSHFLFKVTMSLCVFISAICTPALAFEEPLNSFVTRFEADIQEFDDEALQRLHDFRQRVEAEAYETTLRLCEGYRRVKGIIDPHGRQSGPSDYHGQYVYSEAEALRAWSQVLYHGAAQPITAMGGLKSHYLSGNNIGIWDLRSWFGSLYSMYLVNSFGFLGAAVHCLQTMDQQTINNFAATILIVDYQMSLATHVIALERISALILRAVRWGIRPVARMMQVLGRRVGRPTMLIGKVTIGVLAVDHFIALMQRRDEFSRFLQEVTSQESTQSTSMHRDRRFLQLEQAFREILKYQEQASALCQTDNESEACTSAYDPFSDYIYAHFDSGLIEAMRMDRNHLSMAQNRRTDFDEAYHQLLNGFLDIVIAFHGS